jgi:hypothetical protein
VSKAQLAVEKLEEIKRLWMELELTRPNTPEYRKLMEQIRVKSAEYRVLVDPPA